MSERQNLGPVFIGSKGPPSPLREAVVRRLAIFLFALVALDLLTKACWTFAAGPGVVRPVVYWPYRIRLTVFLTIVPSHGLRCMKLLSNLV